MHPRGNAHAYCESEFSTLRAHGLRDVRSGLAQVDRFPDVLKIRCGQRGSDGSRVKQHYADPGSGNLEEVREGAANLQACVRRVYRYAGGWYNSCHRYLCDEACVCTASSCSAEAPQSMMHQLLAGRKLSSLLPDSRRGPLGHASNSHLCQTRDSAHGRHRRQGH